MIEFQHSLPSLNIEGRHNGTYNNYELGLPSVLTAQDAELGIFLHKLRCEIFENRRLVFIDGRMLVTNINWIRDHVHIMKATRHWERELKSFLDFIIETQRQDGQYYELIKQLDDEHWSFVNEDCYVKYPEDNLALVRLELEADIEYLVVEGAARLYKTTGDDAWLRRVLPKLELGIDYITSDEKRWDKELGLVKRPFTIDTWDFTCRESSARDRRISPTTPMSVMHGDNSGVYSAMMWLSWFNRRLGMAERAEQWTQRAKRLRESMKAHLWNGRFFIHQLHLGHQGVDDLERERLSLSNTYDINRGVTDGEMSAAIIAEYKKRRKTTEYFAEWFSIDPPYEKFNTHGRGQYVNGAISPFTAGELALAAFSHGEEEYGWDIISRFMKLVERDGASYFLYDTDSKPQPMGGPSAWGAASLINAVDEGLAGIVDAGVNYDVIDFSPRFPVTHYRELRYFTGYEVSGALVEARYILTEAGMRYDLKSGAERINAHLLLPKGRECAELWVNGEKWAYTPTRVNNSLYVDFTVEGIGSPSIRVLFK